MACFCSAFSSAHCSSVTAHPCSALNHANWPALKTTCQSHTHKIWLAVAACILHEAVTSSHSITPHFFHFHKFPCGNWTNFPQMVLNYTVFINNYDPFSRSGDERMAQPYGWNLLPFFLVSSGRWLQGWFPPLVLAPEQRAPYPPGPL